MIEEQATQSQDFSVEYLFPNDKDNNQELKSSLKNGVMKNTSLSVKTFTCSCDKHKHTHFQLLVQKKKKSIRFDQCKLIASKSKPAVDRHGQLCLPMYKFYSHHHNWRILNAVAIGLVNQVDHWNINDILHRLALTHSEIARTIVQRLEKKNSITTVALLENLLLQHEDGYIRRIVERALERLKFGINYNATRRKSLIALSNNENAKVIFDRSYKRSALLVKNGLYLYMKKTGQFRLPSIPQHNNCNVVLEKQASVTFKFGRRKKKGIKQQKRNFRYQLFWNNSIPVSWKTRIEDVKAGEIYWAEHDDIDHKLSRPVLILRTSFQNNVDKLLVAPLTSDIQNSTIQDMIVTVNGTVSLIQPKRARIMDRSSLYSKAGEISSDLLNTVITQVNSDQYKEIAPIYRRKLSFCSKRGARKRLTNNKGRRGGLFYLHHDDLDPELRKPYIPNPLVRVVKNRN